MDGNLAFGEANSEFRRLDLKCLIVPANRIVASDSALFFDSKDEVQRSATVRSKSCGFLKGWFD